MHPFDIALQLEDKHRVSFFKIFRTTKTLKQRGNGIGLLL